MKSRIIETGVWASFILSLASLSGCGDSTPPSGAAPEKDVPVSVARPDAYAPMLVVPKSLPDDPGAQMIVMMSNNSDVPPASAVNMPLYPGARVMSAMAPMVMTSNGVKTTSLPSMSLLSADETSEVLKFYQERFADWRYKEFVGTHSFWNGDEDSNPLDITGQFSLLVVGPLPEMDTARLMWPEMRTRIDLRYEPPAP